VGLLQHKAIIASANGGRNVSTLLIDWFFSSVNKVTQNVVDIVVYEIL